MGHVRDWLSKPYRRPALAILVRERHRTIMALIHNPCTLCPIACRHGVRAEAPIDVISLLVCAQAGWFQHHD
jgi:hypothetical protein